MHRVQQPQHAALALRPANLEGIGHPPAPQPPLDLPASGGPPLQRVPVRGELSVTVPGVVDGWNELLTKHGTRTLAQALEPAIGYARDGFGVSEIIADQWKANWPANSMRKISPRKLFQWS